MNKIIGNLLCHIGVHTWVNNIDTHGLAGEHRCKYCNKLGWKAIKWPRCPKRPTKFPNVPDKPTPPPPLQKVDNILPLSQHLNPSIELSWNGILGNTLLNIRHPPQIWTITVPRDSLTVNIGEILYLKFHINKSEYEGKVKIVVTENGKYVLQGIGDLKLLSEGKK